MSLAASKRAGKNAAAQLIQRHPEFRSVPDSEHEHYDAVTTTALKPSSALPFVGVCVLPRESVVEIKSCMVVYGEGQRRGRFLVRQTQHEYLLEESGHYLCAVCAPTPDRELVATKVVPATVVDDLVSGWCDSGRGSPYAQFAWSRVFDPTAVAGGELRAE